MAIKIDDLERAVSRLAEAWDRYERDRGDDQIRDGLIKRFELVYEVSHKTIKRFLEDTAPDPAIYDRMPFQDLIRSANEQDLLLGDWPAWKHYRDMRNRSSHTYKLSIALDVADDIPSFLTEVRYLVETLRRRIQ